ncbi:MAG: hypothetical protein J7K21_03210 [Desulfurococcales archaeon]|nr:hypothetical protein [Desulfurococcales archaeon]
MVLQLHQGNNAIPVRNATEWTTLSCVPRKEKFRYEAEATIAIVVGYYRYIPATLGA